MHTIRLATPADAPALAHLRYEFRATLDPAIEDRSAFVVRCTEWMAERLASGGPWHCWALETASGVAGQLWLQVIEKLPNPAAEFELHAYITNVYVHPEARGAGTGAQLLGEALTFCREQRVDSVILWPTPLSRTLYARHGFAVHDDLMELHLGTGR